MPIVYETDAPVAAAASIAQQLARRSSGYGGGGGGSGGGGGGGGGRGYGSNIPYDTGIQDAIQFRDSSQFAEQRQAQEFQGGFDRQQLAGEQRLNEQHQQFQLQANLQEVTLSQQERMRLQRLKNSIGEVSSDPSLSDQEKSDYIQQIKYNIDPLQRRLAQEKLEQEKITKEALVENRRAQAGLREEEAKVHATKFEDRTKYFVPPNVLSQIASDIAGNANLPPMSPQDRDAFIDQLARQEAMKQGLGVTMFQQKLGHWEAIGPGGAADMGGKSGTGGSGSPGAVGSSSRGHTTDHPSGVTADHYDKIHAEVIDSVDRKIKMTKKNLDTGKEDFLYPQTPEWRKEAIDSEFKARLDRLKEYQAQAPPRPAGGGYKSPFTQEPAPGTPPSGGTPAAAATPAAPSMEGANKLSQALANQFLSRDDLSPEQRTKAAEAIGVQRRLLDTVGGDFKKLNGEDLKKFKEAADVLDAVPKPSQGPRGPAVFNPAQSQEAGRAVQDMARQFYGGGGSIPGNVPSLGELAKRLKGGR